MFRSSVTIFSCTCRRAFCTFVSQLCVCVCVCVFECVLFQRILDGLLDETAFHSKSRWSEIEPRLQHNPAFLALTQPPAPSVDAMDVTASVRDPVGMCAGQGTEPWSMGRFLHVGLTLALFLCVCLSVFCLLAWGRDTFREGGCNRKI